MNDSVRVAYAGLESASAGFNSSMNKLSATIGDLNHQITSVLIPTFVGQTSDNFKVNQAQLNAGFQQMEQVVGRLATVISEANTAYQAADKSAAALFT